MLKVLRTIVQEVSTFSDLDSALNVIVKRVRSAMSADVCSVYLLDNKQYVLKATDGFNSSCVNRVRLGENQGLVALVGSREEPVNVSRASEHPNFYLVPELGEQAFDAFLGVPIIHNKRRLGVMVVQHLGQHQFSDDEESFLITLAVQLASVIAQAEAAGDLLQQTQKSQKAKRFRGTSGANGVAMGRAVVVSPVADILAVADKHIDDPNAEIARFDRAIAKARDDFLNMQNSMKNLRVQEVSLFDVYLSLLDDPTLYREVCDHIRQGKWAPWALRDVISTNLAQFEAMDDDYLRERSSDIKDLGTRLLFHLNQADDGVDASDIKPHSIVVARELNVSVIAELPINRIAGLAAVSGSVNSHGAILARALNIPTVLGLSELPLSKINDKTVILDGYRGDLLVAPNGEEIDQYQALIDEDKAYQTKLNAFNALPAQTQDGYNLPVFVNTGLLTDTLRSLDFGADGVGLFRTEIPFMLSARFPNEQQQYKIYRQQLEAFPQGDVTMRTLDIGGDKSLDYFPIHEDNSALGWRGIRISLDRPELFLIQIRAMLRASEDLNNLRILLPMISSQEELTLARCYIERAYHELLEDGLNIVMPKIGMMVEVPSVVFQIQSLASNVDFFSVGSNDLTQYLLAVDRNNPRVADLYSSFHPSVLFALNHIASQAHKAGRPVGVCGEMAGDPKGALLLMAMGFDYLSMNATSLPKVKALVRSVSLEQARTVLADILTLTTRTEVERTLAAFVQSLSCADLLGFARK